MEEVMGLALFGGYTRAFENINQGILKTVLNGRLKYGINKHEIKPFFPETTTCYHLVT